MVELFSFGQGVQIPQDISGIVSVADDVVGKFDAHKFENPVELLDEGKSFDVGIIPSGHHDNRFLFAHAIFKGHIAVICRPAVDEVFQNPGHAVPINRCCKEEHIMIQYLPNQLGMIVMDRFEPFGVVAEVPDRLDMMIFQMNFGAVQTFHHNICQQFRVSLPASATV